MTDETTPKYRPVLAEKAARAPGKKSKKATNECAPRTRRRRGAQPGNSNARRHGRRSQAYLAARKVLRTRLREMKALLRKTRGLKLELELEQEELTLKQSSLLSVQLGRGLP